MIKVKVLKSVLLVDDTTLVEDGYFTLDSPDVGETVEVPDNPFWKHKIFEGYLEYKGKVDEEPEEEDPWKGYNVTGLKNLAAEEEVAFEKTDKRQDLINKLEAAGVEPEEVKEA